MNFLIFDNELSSLNLINAIIADFRYVTLITRNESLLLNPPTSSYLTIEQEDISNASHVIEILSNHGNDPFDAIFIFNLSLSTSLSNVLQTVKRLEKELPYLFLFFANQNNEIDKNLIKIFKKLSQTTQLTIVISNEISSSTTAKCRIETKSDPKNQQPIGATNLLEFLRNEIQTKKYLHNVIHLY